MRSLNHLRDAIASTLQEEARSPLFSRFRFLLLYCVATGTFDIFLVQIFHLENHGQKSLFGLLFHNLIK